MSKPPKIYYVTENTNISGCASSLFTDPAPAREFAEELNKCASDTKYTVEEIRADSTIPARLLDVYIQNTYPGLKKLIDSVTKKVGLTASEVKMYKKALRELAFLPKEEKERILFRDSSKLSYLMRWNRTKEGVSFWNTLNSLLSEASTCTRICTRICTRKVDKHIKKEYPGIYSIICKVSQDNLHISLSEVKMYKRALRELALSSEKYKKEIKFRDNTYVAGIMRWSPTREGNEFWATLHSLFAFRRT